MADSKLATKYGPWALITGASSGLGTEFARQLAAAGFNLALLARRRERLDELGAKLAGDHDVETRSLAVDLAQRDFMDTLRPQIADIEIGLLVNNAGFGQSGPFLKDDLETDLRMLDVNCRAPLMLTHELGNAMRKRGRGGVVMLASVAGLMPNPYFSHYSATKAWDLYLGEGMHMELAGRGVDVVCLCPGPTRTEFFEGVNVDESTLSPMLRRFIMDADAVVAAGLNGLGKRSVVVPGWTNKLMVAASRVTPRALNARIAGNLMKSAFNK